MIEQCSDLWAGIHTVAEDAIQRYARGLLSPQALSEQIMREWEAQHTGEPGQAVLKRIAQRICSRELYAAWSSPDPARQNRACENLGRYLRYCLQYTRYASSLRECEEQGCERATEEVLQQALEEIHCILAHKPSLGPRDPAAFFKWAQTILIRKAHMFVELYKRKKNAALSLEAQAEEFAEQFVDRGVLDPQEYAAHRELQETLGQAILSLRNRRYQQVLCYTYLVGMAESELASLLHVQVQDIYLWKHRALKALQGNRELMRLLQSWRESELEERDEIGKS